MKRFVLYPLSYGPPEVGPAGIEPATTSTQSCSSICIRSATSKLLFQTLFKFSGRRDGSRTRINAATRDCSRSALGLRPAPLARPKLRFERSPGPVGDWKRAPVTTRHRSRHLHPQPYSPTDLTRCTWFYPGCRQYQHFWQWRSLLCQRALCPYFGDASLRRGLMKRFRALSTELRSP
jgi:hypothetical protein